MQERGTADWAQTPLDRLLARTDVAAQAWIADRLVAGDALVPGQRADFPSRPSQQPARSGGRRNSLRLRAKTGRPKAKDQG